MSSLEQERPSPAAITFSALKIARSPRGINSILCTVNRCHREFARRPAIDAGISIRLSLFTTQEDHIIHDIADQKLLDRASLVLCRLSNSDHRSERRLALVIRENRIYLLAFCSCSVAVPLRRELSEFLDFTTRLLPPMFNSYHHKNKDQIRAHCSES